MEKILFLEMLLMITTKLTPCKILAFWWKGRLTCYLTSSYENPFITATSRNIIGDIHRLSHQLSSVDVPRPLAMICTLFNLRPPRSDDKLFQAIRVWTDVLDICENESFGACRVLKRRDALLMVF